MITATYTCEKCGMSVKSQCAKCDTPLKNKTVTTDNGDKVQVSYCPDCDGMIKMQGDRPRATPHTNSVTRRDADKA